MFSTIINLVGFLGGSEVKDLLHCRRYRRGRFDSWVGKILCRREWLSTLVFLLGESHG